MASLRVDVPRRVAWPRRFGHDRHAHDYGLFGRSGLPFWR
jgi:hypothetical protein